MRWRDSVENDYSDEYFDDVHTENKQSRFKTFLLFFAALVFGAYGLQGVLAANIGLGNGAQEFGQGIIQTTACSGNSSITVKPISTFVNANGSGDFYISGIDVSGVPAQCSGKILAFSAYGDTQTAAAIVVGSSNVPMEISSTGSSFTTTTAGITLSELSATSFSARITTPVLRTKEFAKFAIQSTSSNSDSNTDAGSIVFSSTKSISMPSMGSLGSSSYTVEFWIKFTSTPTDNSLLFQGNNAPGVYVNSSLNQLVLCSWGLCGGQQTISISTLSLNTWYHLAVVRNSAKDFQIFLNGNKTLNSAPKDNNNYSGQISGFGGGGAGGTADFRLTNFRVVNSNAYNPLASSITVPTTHLSAISGTLILLKTLQTGALQDSSGNSRNATANGGLSTSTDHPFS